jgi:hypothetical protein
METPRCSLDAALPIVENLQKYRYILENIDGIFIDFSWFVPNFALHINNIDWKVFWLFICFEDLYISLKNISPLLDEYLSNTAIFCRHVTDPDQGFLVSRLVLTLKPWERGWMGVVKSIYGTRICSTIPPLKENDIYVYMIKRKRRNFSMFILFPRLHWIQNVLHRILQVNFCRTHRCPVLLLILMKC